MYNLYLDKPTDFICEVSVKNASLKNSFARMIVKSDNLTLLFEGKIDNGQCFIPINRLKGIFDENTKGEMKLEVIVEDVYFSPWQDTFKTEEHTSVKVQVKEQKEESLNKPILEVKVKNPVSHPPVQKIPTPVQEIKSICEIFEINSKNFKTTKRNDFKQLVKEYFKENKEYQKNMNSILNEVVNSLK